MVTPSTRSRNLRVVAVFLLLAMVVIAGSAAGGPPAHSNAGGLGPGGVPVADEPAPEAGDGEETEVAALPPSTDATEADPFPNDPCKGPPPKAAHCEDPPTQGPSDPGGTEGG